MRYDVVRNDPVPPIKEVILYLSVDEFTYVKSAVGSTSTSALDQTRVSGYTLYDELCKVGVS